MALLALCLSHSRVSGVDVNLVNIITYEFLGFLAIEVQKNTKRSG